MDTTLSPITVPATSRLRYLGGMAALKNFAGHFAAHPTVKQAMAKTI